MFERLLLGVGAVEGLSSLQPQLRSGRQAIRQRDLLPLIPFRKIEDGNHVEQNRLSVREVHGFTAEPFLEKFIAPPQPLVHLLAGLGIGNRQLLQRFGLRLVAGM